MKKLILFISLMMAIVHIGNSQNELQSLPSTEFGFNATALLSNLLPFDTDISLNTNDNLLFFKTGNGKSYFRTALNFGLETSKQDNNEFSNSFALFKLGFEKKNRLSKSWVFHSGAEAFGSLSSSTTESADPFINAFSSKSAQTRFGVAGIYGMQWMVNNRIAVGTEGYLIFSVNQSNSETTVQGITNKDKSEGISARFDLPRSLLISIYF